jgi:hypothetical protein
VCVTRVLEGDQNSQALRGFFDGGGSNADLLGWNGVHPALCLDEYFVFTFAANSFRQEGGRLLLGHL